MLVVHLHQYDETENRQDFKMAQEGKHEKRPVHLYQYSFNKVMFTSPARKTMLKGILKVR